MAFDPSKVTAALGDIFGGSTSTSGTQRLDLTEADKQALAQQQQRLQGSTQRTADLLNQLSNVALGTQNVPLQTNFGPAANVNPLVAQAQGAAGQVGAQGLDALSRSQLAQGQQSRLAQLAAQRSGIARNFGSTQPGVARALQAQAARQSALNINPLLSQVAQQQQDRDVARAQLGIQGAGTAGQLALSGTDQQAQLARLANEALLQQALQGRQARAEAAGFAGGATQTQGGLLEALAQLASLRGTKTSEQTQESGGLLDAIF